MPKIVFVGQIGSLVANTKTKRKKTPKKNLKGPKNVKNENFGKRKTCFIPIAIKNIFKKIVESLGHITLFGV